MPKMLKTLREDQRGTEEAVGVSLFFLRAAVASFEKGQGPVLGWKELYAALQGAGASPALLQAVHDVFEAVEDAAQSRNLYALMANDVLGVLQDSSYEMAVLAKRYDSDSNKHIGTALMRTHLALRAGIPSIPLSGKNNPFSILAA